MEAQKQDLIVYSDHTTITPSLFKNGTHNMMLVSYRNGSSPVWLLNALLEALVFREPLSLNDTTSSFDRRKITNKLASVVTVASFMHNTNYFTDMLKKSKIPNYCVKLLDFCTDFVLNNLQKSLDNVLQAVLHQFPDSPGSAIILEQPEMLMSLFHISSDDLHSKLISPLMKRCSLLILVTSVDGFDSNAAEFDGGDVIEFARFPVTAFMKSIVCLGLKPLDTGRANDVAGTLRITCGGLLLNNAVHVVETEYLFNIQKETTKLFYR
ncbi:HFR114Cp [Eremothecium sinecaudum]|uniref:HFR114Cp n=1 Tax=Eremothecium sinecaudum TaxID=45286 RepID=A0A0X8HV36_9SACH|nr:HFR114Cp [Eremothecium sinecaudum]AMD21969.1 HFR114Cp [Eremothecium sinecaudum]